MADFADGNEQKQWKKIRLFFLLAGAVWLLCFRMFVSGQGTLINDAGPYYESVKFFLDNISRGVYPLWDPTRESGVPNEFFLRRIGEFNPFYFLILVFTQTGLPFFQSYVLFLTIYFFVGILGFYQFTRRLYGDPQTAFVVCLFLMFSTFTALMLTSFIIFIFVPAVWFFYFLLEFAERKDRHSFLGMIFALMILATTYIPFYFLTIVLVSAVTLFGLFFPQAKTLGQSFLEFYRAGRPFVYLSIVLLAIALLPGVIFLRNFRAEDLVLPKRYSVPLGKDSQSLAPSDFLQVPKQSVVVGGLPVNFMLESLTSDLRQVKLGTVYLPIFIYIPFLLGLYVAVNRRLMALYLIGFGIYLLGVYEAAPVYEFLYDHVFFFKYMRNFQFFLWLVIMPVFILICGEHLRLFLQTRGRLKEEKTRLIFFLVLIHLGVLSFLLTQNAVLVSAYATVALSLLFFILFVLGKLVKRHFLFFLLIIIAVHPIEVFHYLTENTKGMKGRHMYSKAGYLDYLSSEWINAENQKFVPRSNQDSAGRQERVMKKDPFYLSTRALYQLHQGIPSRIFKEYTNLKFILYDQVKSIEDRERDWGEIKQNLGELRNTAFVSQDTETPRVSSSSPSQGAQIVIPGNELKLIHYDVNSLEFKTHLNSPKFLVYNDSFTPAWHAWVNGRPAQLLRANLAFKGLWIPQGESTILLRYGSPFRYYFGYFVMGIFWIVFIWLGVSWTRFSYGR